MKDPALRIGLLIFIAVFWTCAAFHSGGGWNQNARFAQVRSLVEEQRFAVDHFLVYTPRSIDGGGELVRLPIENGEIAAGSLPSGGRAKAPLAWRDAEGHLIPLNPLAASARSHGLVLRNASTNPSTPTNNPLVAVETIAATGDISFANGHFYPNKPPGTSLLAVPAYAVVFAIERMIGIDPDGWWILTVNAWITTIGSIGVASALGAALLFHVARRFARDEVAVFVSLVYALGTMALPYGTMLFDQNVTAAALLGSFALLLRAREDFQSGGRFVIGTVLLAGLCAGFAVLTNYVAPVALVLLALYGGRRFWGWFALGAAGPLMFLAYYHFVCFGSPMALATSFQNPLFLSQSSASSKLLGMFGLPRVEIALMLLISPFRGLFFLSPILAVAAWGLLRWWETPRRREAMLCAGLFALFFTVNSAFEGWHGGYGVAPRYLGPAIPFLALGLVAVWPTRMRLCVVAAGFSALIQAILTVTDPLSPVGTGGIAMDGRPVWLYSPLTDYALPLLTTGRAWPMLNSMCEGYLQSEQRALAARGIDPAAHVAEVEWLRQEIRGAVAQGDAFPLLLATFSGPVSVNPMSICEGSCCQIFEANSGETHWNAFNAGEFLFPGSRWSLLPVFAVTGVLITMACRLSRESQADFATDAESESWRLGTKECCRLVTTYVPSGLTVKLSSVCEILRERDRR